MAQPPTDQRNHVQDSTSTQPPPGAPLSSHTSGHHGLLFILLTVFINMTGIGLIVPVIPDLMRDVGIQSTDRAAIIAGYLLFSYAGMQFICAPIMGNLSDRFGRRPVLLLSLAGMSVDYIVMALAPDLAWLFIGRLLAGAMGATHPAANAAIADLSTSERRARNFGLLGAAGAAGLVIGPAIGGILGEIGVRLPFFASAGLSALAFTYGCLVLPETLTDKHRRRFDWKRANPVGSYLKIGRDKTIILTLLALFFFQFAAQAMPSTWPFFTIEKFGWSKSLIGYSIAIYAIAMVIVQGVLTGPVTRRFGAGRAGIFSLIVLIIAYIGLSYSVTGNVAYGWLLFGALHGFAFPAMQAVMTRRTQESEQGEMQGAVASTMSITAILGPLIMTQIFGQFTDRVGLYFPGAAFMTGCGLLSISVIMMILAMRSEVENPISQKNTAETGL